MKKQKLSEDLIFKLIDTYKDILIPEFLERLVENRLSQIYLLKVSKLGFEAQRELYEHPAHKISIV